METNVSYTIVGIFVIFLTSCIVLGIIWLSSGFSFEHYNPYMVYMRESVSGLSIDSPVEFNGVEVGNVKTISINHKNPELVELLLNIKSSAPITNGTVATLNSRGITGITYVALKDKSNDLTPLVAEAGQAYPVIRTAPSLFVRIDTAMSELSNNFHLITESIQQLLNKENQRAIKKTLSNMQEMTAIMQSQTLPMTYQTLNNLNNMTQSFAGLAKEIKRNPTALIRGSAEPQLGPGEKP